MHNGRFFDSHLAFKLVQPQSTEYRCKFDYIISEVLLDQFKTITLQKELRRSSTGRYFQAQILSIVMYVSALVFFFLLQGRRTINSFISLYHAIPPHGIHVAIFVTIVPHTWQSFGSGFHSDKKKLHLSTLKKKVEGKKTNMRTLDTFRSNNTDLISISVLNKQ